MASRINYFFVCIGISIVFIILVLLFRLFRLFRMFSMSNVMPNVMNSRNIEKFSAQSNMQTKTSALRVVRVGEGDISLQPKQCLVQIIVSQDQLDSTKTELNKMVKTFANAPINAFANKINKNDEKLFENYVIKFDDVKRVFNPIDDNQADDIQIDDGSNSSNYNNPYNDITPTIHFITPHNNFRLDGLISNSDNAYSIVMKIIKYIGLQTDYQ